jgi:hypothetical protein
MGSVMRSRTGVALIALALVLIAFGRAQYLSSTGIRIAGDGADYAAMAESLELEGRAPFVYRPVVPMVVGGLFAGNLTAGFAIVCGLAMFAALAMTGGLAADRNVGLALMAVLFVNYQVLFGAANPARLDMVVFAVQMAFVGLALRGRSRAFFILLPLCALIKESLLLSLGALALAAFPRQRATLLRLAGAGGAFVALHVGVRLWARPTSAMAPYSGGLDDTDALFRVLGENLAPALPLAMLVAWGGLCFVVLFAAGTKPDRRSLDPLLAVVAAFLVLFPIPLARDLHRAWFELLTPVVMFALLSGAIPEHSQRNLKVLGLALAAGLIPYAAGLVAPQHLYLQILLGSFTIWGFVALAISLTLAAAAARMTRFSR